MPPKSTYEYYLNLLGRWPTNLALASQWFLYFKGLNTVNVLPNIQDLLNKQEPFSNWQYNKDVTSNLTEASVQYTQNLGCAWARQVTLPSETINAGHEGLDYGGYMAPATSNTREKYNKLSITMLETNASFIDLVLRPWAIAVGYYGLVARDAASPKYVKCSELDVVMLAKTGYGSPMGIRKIYTFHNVAPCSIPNEEYSYMEEGLRYSKIDFVYDSYSVQDGGISTLITQL